MTHLLFDRSHNKRSESSQIARPSSLGRLCQGKGCQRGFAAGNGSGHGPAEMRHQASARVVQPVAQGFCQMAGWESPACGLLSFPEGQTQKEKHQTRLLWAPPRLSGRNPIPLGCFFVLSTGRARVARRVVETPAPFCRGRGSGTRQTSRPKPIWPKENQELERVGGHDSAPFFGSIQIQAQASVFFLTENM